jgi:hypothetical protein
MRSISYNSKIPWYLESNSQKENALAYFWVQRDLINQQRPSRVMVRCVVSLGRFQTFDRQHFLSHTMIQRTVRRAERITMNKSPTLASFWTSATCLVWNPRTKHCKLSIWDAWEQAGPATTNSLLGLEMWRHPVNLSRGAARKNQGKSRDLTYLKSADMKVF